MIYRQVMFLLRILVFLVSFSVLLSASGCAGSSSKPQPHELSPDKQRIFQTRVFTTTDQIGMLQVATDTLMDLGFIVDRANVTASSISASQLNGYRLRITIKVRPKNDAQLEVLARAELYGSSLDAPEPYQLFFSELDKAWYLRRKA